MNQTYQDTRFVIDGWYNDTSPRWTPYGTGTYLGDTYTINGQKEIIAAYTAYDEIEITKTWDDLDDILGKRPDSLMFTLTDYSSGTPVKLRTYDATAGKWAAEGDNATISLNATDFTGNVWTGTIGPPLVDTITILQNTSFRRKKPEIFMF